MYTKNLTTTTGDQYMFDATGNRKLTEQENGGLQ